MIISICNLKGGAGKTTVSINLAVYFAHQGKRVCVIDADVEQQSSTVWHSLRSEDQLNIDVMPISERAFKKKVEAYEKKYDLLIIDAPPHLQELTKATIQIANLVIIPVKPSPLDIWAFEDFLDKLDELISEEGLPVYGVLMEFDSSDEGRQLKLDKQFLEAFEGSDVPILTKIKKRQAHKMALAMGLGSYEYKDKKAKKEIERMGKMVKSIIDQL